MLLPLCWGGGGLLVGPRSLSQTKKFWLSPLHTPPVSSISPIFPPLPLPLFFFLPFTNHPKPSTPKSINYQNLFRAPKSVCFQQSDSLPRSNFCLPRLESFLSTPTIPFVNPSKWCVSNINPDKQAAGRTRRHIGRPGSIDRVGIRKHQKTCWKQMNAAQGRCCRAVHAVHAIHAIPSLLLLL